MKLTFIRKVTKDNGSPSLWATDRTDRRTYIVRGWIISEHFAHFQATGTMDITPEAEAQERSWWLGLVRETKARGVELRRARIVSEPVTTYIKYEYAGTALNILAGEDVRWLPRTQAARLALPGADFWLFDQRTVLFNHFTGDGGWLGNELVTDDPELARLCTCSFEAVWALATPHADYHPA